MRHVGLVSFVESTGIRRATKLHRTSRGSKVVKREIKRVIAVTTVVPVSIVRLLRADFKSPFG